MNPAPPQSTPPQSTPPQPPPSQPAAPQSAPVDNKTLAIGVLSITACILLVGFLLVTMNPRPAYAIGHLDRVGDYVMFTQQTSNSVENLIIVDAAVKRMHVYQLRNNRNLELLQVTRLDRLPGSAEEERRRRGGP